MTQLSVIVSGRASLSRLRECLESVTAQPYARLDVVVTVPLDDPAARALAETHETRDPRVTVVPVSPHASTATARAAAVGAARGAYVQFVHPDDRLPEGAAAAVAARLDALPEAAAVDVLLCDHRVAHWWDDAAPSGDTELLTRLPRLTSLDERPALLDLAPVLGARVISARLLDHHPGLLAVDGDLYPAYAALLLARRVACCDTVAVVHRRDRPVQRRAAEPERHFAAFGPYERLHELYAGCGNPAVRARLYDRMTADYLATLARRDELPPALVAEYFRRAARHAARFRPEGHRAPGGLDGVRHHLLAHGAYLGYRALRGANDKRRALQTAVGARAGQVAAVRTRRRYRAALRRRVDEDLAVFSAYWGRGVHCNPAALAAELAELAPDIRRVWVVEEDRVPLLPPGTDHVVPGTPHYWDVLARAKYLVNNVNFPNDVVKRPGSVHVQTHHGTPLKRMGVDQRHHPAAAQGLNFDALLERIDRWDYSLSANSHSTETWARAYPSGYRSLDYGYPRNDVYYRATAEDVLAARARLGIAPGRRAVLYAPTHRDHEARWTPRLDLPRLAERLGEDTVLLVRGHYFHDRLPGPRHPRVLDVTGWDPVEELALAADVLVTDYSSLMFDYANLDRPIVIHADDWETYTRVRGVYFDLTAEAPGPVTRGQGELAEVLTSTAWCDETARKQRHDFRLRFCEYDDGHAAERVVRRVFLGEGEEGLPPVLPLGRRTPAPTPEEAARR
ncbi:bifunctional glycosyltransferase family 2 protein/CDP-glycerol:glycerophosphate glycerophosphotransferase [Streptomyces sp. NPDC045431]|uniref:CDP-glycerol:glycerophosphate glycerophosphotransferase n=1 Tax=Streptomyces sp. NPDC045431 TaxID=3155613 RepID=UPI0033C2B997